MYQGHLKCCHMKWDLIYVYSTCVTWIIHMCDMTQSYVWPQSLCDMVGLDLCVFPIRTCDMRLFSPTLSRAPFLGRKIADSCAWRDMCVCVTGCICKSDMTLSRERSSAARLLIHMCDIVWYDLFVSRIRTCDMRFLVRPSFAPRSSVARWLIHMCDVVWHDLFVFHIRTCDMRFLVRPSFAPRSSIARWLIHMCDVVWHDLFVFHILGCKVTNSHVWYGVTWFICIPHSYVWHEVLGPSLIRTAFLDRKVTHSHVWYGVTWFICIPHSYAKHEVLGPTLSRTALFGHKMTHSHVWYGVTWFICDMLWHDWFVFRIRMRDMKFLVPPSVAPRSSVTTLLSHVRDMTCMYVSHDAFVRVTWLSVTLGARLRVFPSRRGGEWENGATYLEEWHDPQLRPAVAPRFWDRKVTDSCAWYGVTWFICVQHVWHESFICVMWLIRMCDLSLFGS